MGRSKKLLLTTCAIACNLAFVLHAELAAQQSSGSQGRRPGVSETVPIHAPRRHPVATSPRKKPSEAVRQASVQMSNSYEATLAPATMLEEQIILDDNQFHDASLGCDSCGMSTTCCCNPVGFLLDWSRADLWMGVTSFSSPANFLTANNLGSNNNGQIEGSFGFQEGFNFGARLPSLLAGQMGSQVGMRFTHTQLDGTSAGADNRTQAFVTAGLFRRVDYGLQGGLVVDYLHDDWVYKADLVQLRGELSFLLSPCHDLGFRFTDSQQVDDTDATIAGLTAPVTIQLSSLNNYRFFYRYRFSERGRGLAELQAGFTEDSGAILGVSLKTPLQNQLGLETHATYLMPPSDTDQPYVSEGWNVGMAIVWTPGRVFGTARDYYRPLMDVADNGSFLMKMVR
jgi:hypothetical protein